MSGGKSFGRAIRNSERELGKLEKRAKRAERRRAKRVIEQLPAPPIARAGHSQTVTK